MLDYTLEKLHAPDILVVKLSCMVYIVFECENRRITLQLDRAFKRFTN